MTEGLGPVIIGLKQKGLGYLLLELFNILKNKGAMKYDLYVGT